MLASKVLNCVTTSVVLVASVTAAAGVTGPVGPVGPVGPPAGPVGPVGPVGPMMQGGGHGGGQGRGGQHPCTGTPHCGMAQLYTPRPALHWYPEVKPLIG